MQKRTEAAAECRRKRLIHNNLTGIVDVRQVIDYVFETKTNAAFILQLSRKAL